MNVRGPVQCRLAFAASWALLMGFGFSGLAQAQHTPDPYNIVGEYNSQYEPYMYATYPNSGGAQPNQDRLDGRSGLRSANSFQSFMDGEEEPDLGRAGGARMSGPGVPYYRANRRFDQEFQRNYRPNGKADEGFYNNQQQLNDKYFQALREPDARKRAQLLRDFNLENMRNARTLSTGRTASVPERDREPARDRFDSRLSSPFAPDLDPDDLSRLAPAARRAGAGSSSLAPSARNRNNPLEPPGRAPGAPSLRPGSARGPASTSPRASSPAGTRAPSRRPSGGSAPSAGDVLDRNELFERATRATAPVVPRRPGVTATP